MESCRTKSICLPFEKEEYLACLSDPVLFRQALLSRFETYPELFPKGFEKGFSLHDKFFSRKQNICLRRIRTKERWAVYLVRPSFLLPYLAAKTDEVEKALYLRRWGVSFEGLTHVFGRYPMFWYRASCSLGRPSLLGTTVKHPQNLPKHLLADEKHTRRRKRRAYLATTAAKGCILGATLTKNADTPALQAAYGEFAKEARELCPSYRPKSVCTDGWEPTQEAFLSLFPHICVILCFWHAVKKLAARCVGELSLRHQLLKRAWNAYAAQTRGQFSQRLRRFGEWAKVALEKGEAQTRVLSLCRKGPRFAKAYRYKGAKRTSNEIDRLMDYQDRVLYAMR